MRALIAGNDRLIESKVVACLESFPDTEIVGMTADGQEAIRIARRYQPDLVITGFYLHDMTGPALTRALRSDSLSPPVVFVISPSDAAHFAQLAHHAGAAVHLPQTELGQLQPIIERFRFQRGYGSSGHPRDQEYYGTDHAF